MLRLPTRDRACIYLAGDGLAMAVFRAGFPTQVISARWHPLASDVEGRNRWDMAMAALAAMLRSLSSVSAVEVRLSAYWVRLAVLPFDRSFSDPRIQSSAANALILANYRLGSTHPPQRISLDPATWNSASLVAGIDEHKTQMIEEIVSHAGKRLKNLRPVIAVAWNAVRSSSVSEAGNFVVIEAERMSILRYDSTGPLGIKVLPAPTIASAADLTSNLQALSNPTVVAPGLPDFSCRGIRQCKPATYAISPGSYADRLAFSLIKE